MATGDHLRDSDVPDIYSCAVCMEHLLDRNPRYLSCHHSFCQQCLQQMTRNGQVSCPTCRDVTVLTNNDVSKLTMNFQLVEMMEHFKQERQPILSSRNCHFCNKEPIFYKCIECNKLLCKSCTTKHHKMKIFRSHTIMSMSEICQEHSDEISHICMKCVQAVCVKCVVLYHADHEAKVEEYQAGFDNLKSNLETIKKTLERKQSVIEKCQNELDAKKKVTSKHKKELQRRRDALVKEIEQIDYELLHVSETERKCDEDVKMHEELKEKYEASCRNVAKLLQSPQSQLVANFLRQSMSAEILLKETEKINIEFKVDLYEEVQWMKEPVLEKRYNNLYNFEIKCPTSIKAVGTDLLVYSDNNTSRFLVFDNQGVVIRSFEGLKEHGNVRCVDVHKNQLYLAQENQITCLSNFNTSKERSFTFMPKIKKLYRMAVANDNILICTDCDYEGKVYEYNTEDDTTKMVLEKLKSPTNISVDHTPAVTRYILSLSQFVKIYNKSWQLLTKITHGLHNPWDAAACPGGFLLADWSSNKITLYSYKGDQVRTVVTEEDGLDYPACLTLNSPHIWVGHGSFGDSKITCFRILK